MALIHPDYEESIRETVTREYLRLFPALEGKYSACFCESADGVKLQW
jgi:galactokinase/galacturonokinase